MMTAEQLKHSLLFLAMQGNLVEQRLIEGTGEELIPKMLESRHTAVSQKIVSKDRKIDQDVVDALDFEIPNNWSRCHLQDVCSLSDGNNVENIKLPYLEAKYLRGEKSAILKTSGKLVRQGERTILVDGENSGEVFLIPEDGIMGSTFKRLWINEAVEAQYVLLVLEYYRPYFRNNKRGAAIPHLNKDIFVSAPIGIPPLEEQKRIVAKIEELLPFVEQYADASTKLDTLNTSFPDLMKKSILQEAVQGKLVPQDPNDEPASELLKKIAEEKKRLIKEGKIKKQKTLAEITEDEIPFEIPESWEWARWGNITESIQYGYNTPAKQTGRIKMVRISDIQNNEVAWDTVPYCDIPEKDIKDYLLKEKDILFARTGGTVGKSFLVKQVNEEAIYAGYLIRTRYSHNLCPEYLKFFMESDLYWNQLRNGTIATAQPNCNGKTLSKMIIPIPPFAEQKRIVAKIEKFMSFIDKLVK